MRKFRCRVQKTTFPTLHREVASAARESCHSAHRGEIGPASLCRGVGDLERGMHSKYVFLHISEMFPTGLKEMGYDRMGIFAYICGMLDVRQ